jgi:hypothetical protein
MRNALTTFLAIGLTAGLSAGCLSDLIPSHQGSVAADAGMPGSGGGNGGGNGDGTGGGNGTGGGMGDGGGGGGGGGGDAGGTRSDCVDRVAAANLADGHHNPGLDCMTCHDGNTANAPKYFLAGTVYDSVTGTNAYAGGTITWTDSAGVKGTATAMANGNFYVETAVAFPIQVKATSCPTITPMVGAVAAGQGSCNSGACHSSAMRIHLP